MKFITNVLWEYSNIVPDYVIGKTTCAIFLSIRYHELNPDYIHERLKLLGNAYNLRILLVQVWKYNLYIYRTIIIYNIKTVL